jgi:hypothetical protein
MSCLVTSEHLQALFQRLDHFERELLDIKKTINSDSKTNGDNPMKRKDHATSGDRDVEKKKTKMTDDQVPKTSFGKCNYFQNAFPGHDGEEAEILEQGRIFFFFRPKADLQAAHSFAEVQRLYILLCPGSFDQDALISENEPKRLLVVGRKKLPDAEGFRTCSWCSVVRVTSDMDGIQAALGAERRVTATEIHHSQPARPCGEGVYAFVKYPRHVHLAYVLEMPAEIGEVQQSFNIDKEFSYIVAVKNPTCGVSSVFSSASKPENFPPALIDQFAGRAWLPATPELLNVESAELLMIGTSRHVEEDLGEVGAGLEELQKLDMTTMHGSDTVFDELKYLSAAPQEPLTQGTWK